MVGMKIFARKRAFRFFVNLSLNFCYRALELISGKRRQIRGDCGEGLTLCADALRFGVQ
jgi:hypothetical protein